MLCVLAVFIPSFFMEGAARALFVPLSLAVGFAMAVTWPSAGNIGGIYDLAARAWSQEMLDALGLDRDKLPTRLVDSGTSVGDLLPALAASLGLHTGIAVVAGGVDAAMATQFARRTEGELEANKRAYALASADLFFTAGIAQNTVFFADIVALSGNTPDAELNPLTLLNGYTARLVAQNELNLREVWLRTELFGQRLAMTTGRMDLTNYFDANAFANDESAQFLSDALVNNQMLGLTSNGTGVAAEFDPKNGFRFKFGLQQSNTDATNLSDSMYSLGEVGYYTTLPGLGEGNYRVWGRRTNAVEGAATAWGLSVDQKVSASLTLFGRFGDGHVPVEAADEHGVVRRDRVDPVAPRQRGSRPQLVVPVAAQNPFPRAQPLGKRLQAAHELRGRGRVAQVHGRELKAAVHEMGVPVAEPRHHEAATRVEDLRAGARAARHVSGIPDDGDPPIAHRYGARLRPAARRPGPHHAVENHQIGALAAPGGAQEQEQRDQPTPVHARPT